MALVVEDGTGLVNADSYLSVTDADTYHENLDNTAWTGSSIQKEAALRKATQYLDGKYSSSFPGTRLTDTQSLSWPRTGALYTDDIAIDDASVPREIENACAELAVKSLSAELDPDISKSDRAIRETVDVITVVYAPGTSTSVVYKTVQNILSRIVGSYNTARIRRT